VPGAGVENCLSYQDAENQGYSGPRRQWSLLALVVVNLLPLAGVLFLGWDVGALVLLYWAENLIIGFYTLLKMLVNSPWQGLGTTIFFLIHYGGFCAIHGMFVIELLLQVEIDPTPEKPWPLFLVVPQMLLIALQQLLEVVPSRWLLAFGALFISHGISFVLNFLLGGEREGVTQKQLMASPYGRIVVLHIAIIFGGIAVQAMGEPVAMLVVLVLLKLGLDIKLHLRQHGGAAHNSTRAESHPI
jgi:hypothetical protein